MSDNYRVGAFSLYGPLAASHRVRFSQFQSGLRLSGFELEIYSLLDDRYLERRFAGKQASAKQLAHLYLQRLAVLRQSRSLDVAIIYCELLPFFPAWFEQRLLSCPYIFDYDDAFYLKYRRHRLGLVAPWLDGKINRLIAGAAFVTAGNSYLADHARRLNPNVTVLPSVVDTDRYQPISSTSIQPRPFTVGWIGSPSTAPYLQLLEAPLREFARTRSVRLLVIGGPAPSIPGVEVISLPWSYDMEVQLIQQFDVGVMPLPDTPWTRGKCAYKLIQCLACAVPVIASPVGANLDVVAPTCGFLADSPEEWFVALQSLADNPQLRARFGNAGRRRVEQHYSILKALPLFKDAIKTVVAQNLKLSF